jgi:D-glycero-alpha-D-manno-heptose-7-phosphate kinase
MRVTVTAPCRADFAGGTLDIWPLGLLHRGALTVNVAIPVLVRLRVELSAPVGHVEHSVEDGMWRSLGPADSTDLTAAVCFALKSTGGARVTVLDQAPLGSGLGGSSSYAVALARSILALEDRSMGDRALVALLRDIEARVMQAPAGIQDHWAALRGGVLAIHLEPGGESVETLAVDEDWMGARFSVFFTNITHHSGMVNWQVIKRRIEGDDTTRASLGAIADAAQRCRQALLAGDETEVAAALAAEWSARRRLAPEVCPPELQALEAVALEAGVTAVKACGAGGGGSLLLWHPPGHRDRIAEAMKTAVPGGWLLTPGVARNGCEVQLEPSPERPLRGPTPTA